MTNHRIIFPLFFFPLTTRTPPPRESPILLPPPPPSPPLLLIGVRSSSSRREQVVVMEYPRNSRPENLIVSAARRGRVFSIIKNNRNGGVNCVQLVAMQREKRRKNSSLKQPR